MKVSKSILPSCLTFYGLYVYACVWGTRWAPGTAALLYSVTDCNKKDWQDSWRCSRHPAFSLLCVVCVCVYVCWYVLPWTKKKEPSVAYQPPSLGVVLQGGRGCSPGNFFSFKVAEPLKFNSLAARFMPTVEYANETKAYDGSTPAQIDHGLYGKGATTG